MLMPSASVSVANTALTRPRDEQLLDDLLERRQHPGVVGGDRRARARRATRSSRGRAGPRRDVRAARARRSSRIRRRSSGVVSRSPRAGTAATAASQPARLKMNMIAGSRPSRSSRVDHVGAGRRSTRRRGRAAAALRPPRRRGPREPSAARRRGPAACSSGLTRALRLPSVASTNRSNSRLPTSTCCHSGTGRCSSTITRRVAADGPSHSPNSSALLTVADSETSRHRLRQVDDHLLPDRAAEPVGQVVHLVHHDVAEAGQRGRAGVEHVAQHLGGHHDHRRVAVDRVVAGQQADPVGAVAVAPGRRTSGSTAP